jgi:hypothetical protein
MAKKAIQQTLLGGPYAEILKPGSVTSDMPVHVKTYSINTSRWGERYDYIVIDTAGKKFVLSSWNIETDKKFEPDAILGQELVLRPSSTGKKIFFTVPN